MADTKISALTALAESPANDDVFPIVDITADATKKITAAFLLGLKLNAVTVTGSLAPNILQYVSLNSASAIALTLSGTPPLGGLLVIKRIGTGVITHTVVLGSGIDWDTSGNGTASFDTDGDILIAVGISSTRWEIIYQSGVTFSA